MELTQAKSIIQALKRADRFKQNCEHKNIITYKNIKAYVFKKQCKDCKKVIDFKLK